MQPRGERRNLVVYPLHERANMTPAQQQSACPETDRHGIGGIRNAPEREHVTRADRLRFRAMIQYSARTGDAGAQYSLGVFHVAGVKGAVDIVEAYKWFSLAAEQGMPAAAQHRDLLDEYMSPEDYSMAFQRIAEFRALPR